MYSNKTDLIGPNFRTETKDVFISCYILLLLGFLKKALNL